MKVNISKYHKESWINVFTWIFFLSDSNAEATISSCFKSKAENKTSKSDEKLPLIDIFINQNKSEDLKNIVKTKTKQFKDYFARSDMRKLFPNLFKILWFSSLPCVEHKQHKHFLIRDCKVADRKIECSKIFTKIPTDSGMCCALNVDNALKHSQYTELVEEMQKTKEATEPGKRKLRGIPGKKNGIKITLDLHSNFASFGTVFDEVDVFQVFIGQANEFPHMRKYGFGIQPGHEHFISLSTTILSADQRIRKIAPLKRNCYFSDEGSLEFYKLYTYSNCVLECSIKMTEKQLNCTPWYLPQGLNSVPCDPWTARRFASLMSTKESQCPHCLPDCERNISVVTPTLAKFG